jgi:DnaJ-class molecular chaperone
MTIHFDPESRAVVVENGSSSGMKGLVEADGRLRSTAKPRCLMCHTCQGTGKVLINLTGEAGDAYDEDCPSCQGTGRI